ncbi:alpha/beta hydrolase-fold protein [candidate division KSB1 bacterium]
MRLSKAVTGPFLLSLLALIMGAATADEVVDGVQILDRMHSSDVMGEMRQFRVFLPPDYDTETDRRYPVVYYFHGWSQRYFGSRPGGNQYEKGDDNGGDNFAAFVAANPVIVVKWDGFNPRYPGEDYFRPYNISPVETHRRYPLYFPEFMEHIDSHFRTIADREHRGVTGLSMGGFMAFWIGGKYPELFGSVSNFMGSDEFVIGPKKFPVEYRHAETFPNFKGRPVRHHMGSRDFIRGYHARMNRTWDFVLDKYERKTFDSEHGSAGLGEMLSFHLNAFRNPTPMPEVFDHIEVYPRFEVRGYSVATDRHRPGLTTLERIGPDGFRVSVRKWLPDGPVMNEVNLTVTTDSLYQPGELYVVTDIDIANGQLIRRTVRASGDGRIVWSTDGSLHEIGITARGSERPLLSLAGTAWADKPWLEPDVPTGLILKIVNKGAVKAGKVQLTVSPHNPEHPIEVKGGRVDVGDIYPGRIIDAEKPVRIEVKGNLADRIRLDLVLKDGQGNTWRSDFTLPVSQPGPEAEDFTIADGRLLSVLEHGNRIQKKFLGRGNGDGVANPGETVVILISHNDTLRMADITSNDSYLNPFQLSSRFTDNWGSFDHVGGSNKVSQLLISSLCPPGRKIPLHFHYLVPDYPEHFSRAGRVTISVKGKDLMPPELDFLEMTADNRLQARIRDGGVVAPIWADIFDPASLDKRYRIQLRDDGVGADRTAGDLLFAAFWRPVDDGAEVYRVKLKATDRAGNAAILESDLTIN